MRAIPKILPILALVLAGATPPVHAQGAPPSAQQSAAPIVFTDMNVKGKNGAIFSLRRVEVTGSNLTRDEIASILNPDAGSDKVLALISRFKAAKFSIPDAVLNDPEVTLTFRDLVISNIDSGRIGSFSFGGFSGTGTGDDGYIVMKSGALEFRDVNLARLLSAAIADNPANISLQVGSMSWRDFEFSMPDKDTPVGSPGGNLIKVTFGSVTGENVYDGEIPIKSTGKGEHIAVVLPKASAAATQLAAFGLEDIDAGFSIAGAYDRARQTYTLTDLGVTAASLGAINLTGAFGGIAPTLFTGDIGARQSALLGVDISSLALAYRDDGLFAKALAFVGKQQNKKAEDLRSEWSALATQFLPLLLGGDPGSLRIAETVGRFVGNPTNITVSVKAKGAPVKATDIAAMSEPKDLLSRVEISATTSP